jgi:hypothetical protein
MKKQYFRSCDLCDRHMISTNPELIYCSPRCAKRARFTFDPARSRRPIVSCTVCGRPFVQEAALGRLRVCCPLHYGGYRNCAACGARCRPRPGGKLCRKCKARPPAVSSLLVDSRGGREHRIARHSPELAQDPMNRV